MFYIKMDEEKNLYPTAREPIYRGESLNRKVVFLLPFDVDGMDTLTAYVYLNYVRPDGTADVAELERLDEPYNESWIQFTFPVDDRLTRQAGEACLWLAVYDGDGSVSKSGECTLRIQPSKSVDEYATDGTLSAIQQMRDEMSGKADGLSYDGETRALHLTSGGEPVGDAVTVPSDEYGRAVAEEIIAEDDRWTGIAEPDSVTGNQVWEPM